VLQTKALLELTEKKIFFSMFMFLTMDLTIHQIGFLELLKMVKIGYADMNGNIIIQPQFDCAYPFKNGKAKVGKGCNKKTDGEHSQWTDGKWYTIDKKGKIIKT